MPTKSRMVTIRHVVTITPDDIREEFKLPPEASLTVSCMDETDPDGDPTALHEITAEWTVEK